MERAVLADRAELCELYRVCAGELEKAGLDQWHWGRYPAEKDIDEDLAAGRFIVEKEAGRLTAAVSVFTENGPYFPDAGWSCGVRPGVFRLLAVRPDMQRGGIGSRLVRAALDVLREAGCDCVRCDTHRDNANAIAMYKKIGMRIHEDREWYGGMYTPFDMQLQKNAPLLPVRMNPAYRAGALTPWGGDRLRLKYGKNIPTVPTGESLEVSCIPGLESRDDSGRTLPELIREYGERFVGKYAGQPFPLLLKLIDASDTLSVQVHPDDAYAAAHEGKLGKTEAWLILDAPEDGELVYGILPGTDMDTLRDACERGGAVKELLRRVRVKPGDVCFIPAGCVHAIGKGIMLYEIQQSSDVTYRFYDWDRTDKQGKRRELHIDKALDVTDLSFALEPKHISGAASERVLDEKYFTLDLLRADGGPELPEIDAFGLLTALDDEPELVWEGGSIGMQAGESYFLPCASPKMRLRGHGRAALAMPV